MLQLRKHLCWGSVASGPAAHGQVRSLSSAVLDYVLTRGGRTLPGPVQLDGVRKNLYWGWLEGDATFCGFLGDLFGLPQTPEEWDRSSVLGSVVNVRMLQGPSAPPSMGNA